MFLEVQGNQVKSTAFFSEKINNCRIIFYLYVGYWKKKNLFIVEYDNGLPYLFKMIYGIRFRYKMWNENSNYSHICGLKSDLAAVCMTIFLQT